MKMTSTVTRLTRRTAIALWLCCGVSIVAQAQAQAQEPGLLWFEGKRPSLQARQAAELLATSATHGLEPQDYNASALRQAILNAAHGVPQAITVERMDQALTSAMEHYLKDVHQGRIDPKKIQHNFNPPRRAFDPAAYLQTALAARRLPQAAAEAAPHLPLYEELRTVLAYYRERGDDPAWQQPLPALPGGARKLAPGQRYAGLSVLAQRLVALGDLAPDVALPTKYEGLLVPAVQSFQTRHGIAPDGVIGKSTLVQLQVTPAARVRQIELALERLRWTPFKQGPRMVVINIPEFVLRAYDVEGERIHVRQEMRIVVGKALDRRTPLFNEEMRFVEFSPYWNVPPSIARAEIIPQLRRDPGYLAREGMEFVSADGALVDSAVTPARLKAVLAGQWRIRQRPGPKNALGDIKFVFPNTDNIYLHHTSAVNLFERERRDLSHGCIRVEKPVALAKFVLGNMPQWSEERIKKAMNRGESSTLRLTEPIPVVIAYETALVKDGAIYFFEDIYGLDRRLDAALHQQTRYASSSQRLLND
ncbi:MAG: L,D-transpeptidase family protein [Polaromonas sp.]|nr:L,D-transpeptidase family protein [Polaromonas sp.]